MELADIKPLMPDDKSIRWQVIRTNFTDKYTEGYLFRNGVYVCDTLERRYRDPVSDTFVRGDTAIPFGTYGLECHQSKTTTYLDKWMVYLKNVPNFSGIMFHDGVWPTNSVGCVLVGRRNPDTPGSLVWEKPTFQTREAVIKQMREDLKSGKKVLCQVTAFDENGKLI